MNQSSPFLKKMQDSINAASSSVRGALSHEFSGVTFQVVPTQNHLPDYVKQAKRNQGGDDGKTHGVITKDPEIGKIRFNSVAEHLDTQAKVEETVFYGGRMT